ncbi:hypothetical protein ACPV5W_04215 [Vibrio astriarenae]
MTYKLEANRASLLILCATVGLTSDNVLAQSNDNSEKNPEDPTKIITKLGVGYSNEKLTLSGNIGLDDARMLNGRINDDGSEWSLGGSWLFDAGIVNFNFRKTAYDDNSTNTSYNLGSYFPLSEFGFSPYGWMPFITAGYSYNDGEKLDAEQSVLPEVPVYTPVTSHAGYVGMFALKPWSEKWTTMAFAGTTQGSSDLSVYWGGAGLSYRLSERSSVNGIGIYSDSSIYGSDTTYSVNYRYEWN